VGQRENRREKEGEKEGIGERDRISIQQQHQVLRESKTALKAADL